MFPEFNLLPISSWIQIWFFLVDSGGGEMQAEGRFNKPEGSRKDEQQQQPLRQDGGSMPGSDEGTIRTYAGLSATTQERIRRYVML